MKSLEEVKISYSKLKEDTKEIEEKKDAEIEQLRGMLKQLMTEKSKLESQLLEMEDKYNNRIHELELQLNEYRNHDPGSPRGEFIDPVTGRISSMSIDPSGSTVPRPGNPKKLLELLRAMPRKVDKIFVVWVIILIRFI